MVAVGSLERLWLDLPDTLIDMESLIGEFEGYFGHSWSGTMVGAGSPIVDPSFWNAFFSVSGLQPPPAPMLLDDVLARSDDKRFNILIG